MDLISYRPEYVQYEQLLKHLHHLIAVGDCDSDQADAIRDSMESLMYHLTEQERNRLEGLSGDLYMLNNEEVLIPVEEDEKDPVWFEQTLRDAWTKQDWDRVIALLRADVPFLNGDHRAYLRARAYEHLGHLDVALRFMDHAAKLNPYDPSCPYLAMHFLEEMERFEEAKLRAEAWLTTNNASAGVIIGASQVLFKSTEQMDSDQAEPVYYRLIKVLLGALGNQRDLSHFPKDVLALAYIILGSSYMATGQAALGFAAFERLSRIRPDDALISNTLISMKRQFSIVPPVSFDLQSLPQNYDSLPQNYDEEKLRMRDYLQAA